jgi:uncharacterized protein (TIGR03435 family)
VKPSRPNQIGGGFDATPGRFDVENRPLSEILFYAFDVDRFRLVGPEWIARERFDITATGAITGQTKPMLRRLLQDRFGLRARMETRTQDVYLLTILRPDGGLGSNLRRVEMDCSHREPLADGMMPCSTRNQPQGTLVARGTNWRTSILLREISAQVDRLVLDRTGLDGQFDMRLEWTDPLTQALGATSDRPGFVTALREQLGLTLEPAKEPVQVLVVDHVERPSPN